MGRSIERPSEGIRAQILTAGFTVGGPLQMRLREISSGQERTAKLGQVRSVSPEGVEIQGLSRFLDFDQFHPGRIVGIIETPEGVSIRFGNAK